MVSIFSPHPYLIFLSSKGVLPSSNIKFFFSVLHVFSPLTLKPHISSNLGVILCACYTVGPSSYFMGRSGAKRPFWPMLAFLVQIGLVPNVDHCFCNMAWWVTKNIVRHFMLFQRTMPLVHSLPPWFLVLDLLEAFHSSVLRPHLYPCIPFV
jgi:hypothetical protein